MEHKPKYSLVPSDYRLLEEIGHGVSGTVFRAYYIPRNEVIAVKQLNLEKCNADLDNIRREAQTMTLICHPNVVTAYCSFVVGQHLWVVMPYLGGGSCLHIMQFAFPDGLEEIVIATILRDTLKALEYLHRHGHIHRDVKAGNILVDDSGGVKLGDFGISACMFDTGNRQWHRNTFVGTPCWMAPEVLENSNGHDFKADIWSFGITALELAHGHAPFAKYPPMKVFLMTLQNPPPGLTYERDRRFSKSFKEMIATCLVKDPTKRPTAEKLLKHSFFKNAKSSDYIVRNVLVGLPALYDRVKTVQLKDARLLAEKEMPYGEQEERSQNEYKRGVSGWNFDVEDLRAQAALLQDDECPKKEEEPGVGRGAENVSRVASPLSTISNAPNDESHQQAEMSKTEIPQDMEECVLRTTSLPCPKPLNGAKVRGRFNVFVDNVEVDTSNWCEGSDKADDVGSPSDIPSSREKRCEEREVDGERVASGKDHDEHYLDHPTPSKSPDDEKDRDLVRQSSRLGDEHSRERGPSEHRPTNGVARPPSGPSKDEDKVKGNVVQKKGRFSVTSADVEIQLKDLKENKDVPALPSIKVKGNVNPADHGQEVLSPSSLKRSSSAQQVQQPPISAPAVAPSGVAAAGMIIPHLQTLLSQTAVQQDMIVSLITNVCSGESNTGLSSQRLSRSSSVNAVSDHAEADRERELRQQLAELQSKQALLLEEIGTLKTRNVQLERQLNAIFNKEEEERIRKEDAAKEDG